MNQDPIQLLADVLLRGALLLPLCLFLALVLRRGSASLIRRFWRCSLIALIVASLLTVIPPSFNFEVGGDLALLAENRHPAPTQSEPAELVPGSPVAPLEDVLGIPRDGGPIAASNPASSSTTTASTFKLSIPVILAALWLTGVLVLLVRKLLGSLGVHRLRKSALPVDDPAWNQDLAKLCKQCGIKNSIELRSHLVLRSPIVTGARKPIIVLPIDYAEYSSHDRQAVLLHELAHVHNRDAIFRWVAALAKILHWPNPLVWYAERALRLAEERSSDDAVLNGGVTAPTYAELLARLAKGGAPVVGDLGVASGSAMAQPSGLLHRVHAILRPGQTRRQPGALSSLALAVTVLTLAALIGSSSLLEADEKKKPSAAPTAKAASQTKVDQKLRSIVFPKVDFNEATLDEALDFIRTRSREFDPKGEGVNVISKVPRPKTSQAGGRPPWEHLLTRKITLNLEQVPLSALLDFIGNINDTVYRTSEYALIISLRDYESLETRNFRIPSEVFEKELTRKSVIDPNDPFGGGGGGGAGGDPFATDEPVSPTYVMSAMDWLKENGVNFAPGTSAFYTRAAGTLNIRNTPLELDFVENIINSLNGQSSRGTMSKADAERLAVLKRTLKETIIPSIELQDASLSEALEFVRQETEGLQKESPNPIQFVLNLNPHSDDIPPQRVSLNLNNVPAGVAIKHIVDLGGAESVVSPYGIEVRDRRMGETIRLVTFDLPPATLKKIHESMAHPPEKFPIINTFKNIGIDSPPGTGAFWNSTTGEFIVRQTTSNLSQIDSFLQGLATPEGR